jgi:hypothetical protein
MGKEPLRGEDGWSLYTPEAAIEPIDGVPINMGVVQYTDVTIVTIEPGV